MSFRIMPAQRPWPSKSCTRYGFAIYNHPLGDPKLGYYIATWRSQALASVAAHCLGYHPSVVQPISYLVPTYSATVSYPDGTMEAVELEPKA